VVIAVAGAEVRPAFSVVVVVAWVTVTVFAAEVLEVSSAAVVGVKVAVRELLPNVSEVVARVQVPAVAPATPAPSTVLPLEKLTVPAAFEGVTVAVRVTLAPKAAVVIAVVGADVRPTAKVAVVVACDTVTVLALEVLGL
jgi:hypothetical protein